MGDEAIALFPAVGDGADDRLPADASATDSDLRLPAPDEQQERWSRLLLLAHTHAAQPQRR